MKKHGKENNVKILGEPLPVPSNVDFDTDKAFDFQFELGLLSDFELPTENQLELKRPQVSLDDNTLAETHEQITRQFGETTNPEAAEATDYLVGKLKKAGAESEGQTILLPINKVQNGQERFVGAKPGDTITFDPQREPCPSTLVWKGAPALIVGTYLYGEAYKRLYILVCELRC